MSDKKGMPNSYIDKLVVKAIEKKKQQQQQMAKKNKPKLDYVLFSQFDVLDTIVSKNGNTTLYHLAKKGAPEKQICCKVVNEDAGELERKMLQSEASRLEISQHPSVAEFIKIGNEFERPYFMYEWIQGESLAEKMERHSSKGFRHDHIAWLVYQLAGALEYMHTRGVCHLDIKPSNILVSDNDNVKLIDFGASRYVGEPAQYAEASVKYASPEYLKSGEALPKDDVYSLALLTGHLFLGYIFGDAWQTQLTGRKRPALIPGHVWNLIREVVSKPRKHGFTAISFAQRLASIDVKSLDSNVSAPIFNNLRNADLVLTQRKAMDRFPMHRFKYLEISLVISVMLITGTYLYDASQPEWHSIVKSEHNATDAVGTIKPAQTASFLAQSPWEIEYALDDMNSNVVSTAPYREAYQVQQVKLGKLYDQYQNDVSGYQRIAENLPENINNARAKLVKLRQQLSDDGALFPEAEQTLNLAMAGMSQASVNASKLTEVAGDPRQKLVNLILAGKSDEANQYLKSNWLLNQSQSYFVSKVLPKEILDSLYQSVDANAEKRYYTQAISQVEAAMQFFGRTAALQTKARDLRLARSEYVLFSTVNGDALFDTQKLGSSLADLERISPKKFVEVTELLNQMATDSIQNSHQQSRPAKGALAVKRALIDYRAATRS